MKDKDIADKLRRMEDSLNGWVDANMYYTFTAEFVHKMQEDLKYLAEVLDGKED